MKTWLTLFLLSLLLTGCNSGLKSTYMIDESTTELVAKGTFSMQNQPEYQILKASDYPIMIEGEKETLIYYSDVAEDVEAFKEAYLHLTNEIAPQFEGTIIIAKMGKQRSGGYSIEVERIEDSGRFIEVTLGMHTPTGLVTMALTNPYIVLYLPKSHKEIKIIEK
jgi:hypothetical protein